MVRQPFTADGAPPVKLSSILREIGPGQVAVAAGICRPAGRVTVNLYQRSPTGQLHLDVASVDVLHALHAAGVVVNVCPDPAAAQPLPSRALQSSNEVLMVSPTAFVFNEQAAQVSLSLPNNSCTLIMPGSSAAVVARMRLGGFLTPGGPSCGTGQQVHAPG